MKRNGWNESWLNAAPWPRALAFTLLIAVLAATPAGAQEERLPSVSDYRLPPSPASPSSRPSGRSQGPVDGDNPVILRPSREPEAAAPSAPAQTPAPAPSASAPAARRAAAASPAAAAATARPAGPASPSSAAPPAAAPPAPGSSAPRQQAPFNAAGAPPPAAVGEAGQPSATPAAAVPPVTWNVHSAKPQSGMAIWPWLAGIAALLATNGLLLFLLLRRRQARAAAHAAAEYEAAQAAETASPVSPIAAGPQIEPVVTAPVPSAENDTAAELDLLNLLAQHDRAAPAGAPGASPEPAQRPALDLFVNPLEVTLAARRLSATLMNTVLNYELVVANNSDGPIGPVAVAGDMIGAHASLPTRAQLEIGGTDIAPQHRIEQLGPGDSVTVSGELRLPLAAITPIRNGDAALFVPLARFRVEALRGGAPPLAINRTFVIGESQDRPGAALKPFRLDLGPRLYSQIGQREVAATA